MRSRLPLPLFIAVMLIIPVLAFAHGGREHVLGTVASIDEHTIVVRTKSGDVSVPLAAATRYFHGSGTKHPARADEVRDGMRVVVHYGADGRAAEVHIP